MDGRHTLSILVPVCPTFNGLGVLSGNQDDLLAGVEGILDFLHRQAVLMDIQQGRGLVGRRDVVNPLALGIGFLQSLDRRNPLAGILIVDEHLFRHGVFQGL
jgi:hypothetical protein